MNKRDFLKWSFLAGSGMVTGIRSLAAPFGGKQNVFEKKQPRRHWVWEHPDPKADEKSLHLRFKSFYDAGIRGIFFESDSKKHFVIARAEGLEAHRWMWTMNRGESDLLHQHPDWYAVSRSGKSCATNPPYVDYYRWLCPSRTEVKDYLSAQVREILDKPYVDGIHLDYVRYCDVILPVNLWQHYGIVQQKELPDYDFCYCPVCRAEYQKIYGVDPLTIQYPDQSPSWRTFRYGQVNSIVNHLAEIAHSKGKKISAAVFPTPEVARRIVRQDWTNWNLDMVCPMIYQAFYRESVRWINDAVEEGVRFIDGRFPLYAGLFVPDLKTDKELSAAMTQAITGGASGISFFGDVDSRVLTLLKNLSV